jgi:hypothetical protein
MEDEVHSRVTEVIRQAIGTGEIIGIRYHGGSQPGVYRQIIPIKIEGNQLRAHCLASGSDKTFRLEHIELQNQLPPSQENIAASWVPPPISGVEQRELSIEEILAEHRDALTQCGWLVEFDVNDDGKCINLFGFLKNGKQQKSPSLTLEYVEWTGDLTVMPDGSLEMRNIRKRARPWSVRVRGKGGISVTWGHPDKAVEAFLKAAREEPAKPNA